MSAPPAESAAQRRARLAGAVVQGLLLGALLALALIHLFAVQSGAQVFRYQAF